MVKRIMEIVHNPKDEEDLIEMQKTLLMRWWSGLLDKKLGFIPEAKVSFKNYSLFDYPDQDTMKNLVRETYINKHGDFYWAGEQYTDFNSLYEAVAEQKQIAELLIEIEE